MEQEITMEQVKAKYPSICYSCRNARKPASDENTIKGYVGCTIRAMERPNRDADEITAAKVVGEGWVDLRSEPKIGKGSGMITNMQLVTKGVKACNLFAQK